MRGEILPSSLALPIIEAHEVELFPKSRMAQQDCLIAGSDNADKERGAPAGIALLSDHFVDRLNSALFGDRPVLRELRLNRLSIIAHG
jgi:hypothetical protein